ncbi:ABC transporter permease [Gordonia sp. DT30]|uniref:ABC transporter permease n=1 Tax=unclassified Gordonia (in: high G+C Gram-positive bacteria) TaxID=2657482 RepID=UPI003CF46F76
MIASRSAIRLLYSIAGCVLLLAAVEIVGKTQVAGKAWPPLSEIVDYAFSKPGWKLIRSNAIDTLTSAAKGFVLGAVVAVIGAALGLIIPVLRPGFDRLAALLNAIPTIALAPLLITTVGRTNTPVVIAALSVGFVTFVATTAGLADADGRHQDLFSVMGSSRWQRLRRLEYPHAVPALLDGLTLAAPAAILGATIGEWFGAPKGLGLIIVSAMQNYQMTLLWSAALAATVMSLVAYLVFVQIQRIGMRRFT